MSYNGKRLTREQAAIVGAYTGVSCGPFSDIHSYVEKVLGRPVWTHEMAGEEVMTAVRDAAKADFLAICARLSDE